MKYVLLILLVANALICAFNTQWELRLVSTLILLVWSVVGVIVTELPPSEED